jgi:hypothetical protein
MALGKKTIGLMLAGAAWLSAAQFEVRHEHLRKGCNGILTIDENGVSFAGQKDHKWAWKFDDIQQLKLAPNEVNILTYKDSKLRFGADRAYDFRGSIAAVELYPMLSRKMDQRFVARLAEPPEPAGVSLPVKLLGRITGSEGTLDFADGAVVYSTPAKGESRTWRYSDIDNISSSGRFQLTITTAEKSFNFQLKQPLAEARYNELWLSVEKKNGRIQ